jgi:SAM-dependent methyltransferase
VELRANAARFSGFADLYDRARPSPPSALAEVLCAYAGDPRPALVVDLGCGTGLSSRWCGRWADRVIGIEPSADMRAQAQAGSQTGSGETGAPGTGAIEYREGWGHRTGLPDGCASVVVAVQSLHWMDPPATFAEIRRLLRPGGVFAAIDCDWPPSVGSADAEQAWQEFVARADAFGPSLTVDSSLRRSPEGPPAGPTLRPRLLSAGAQGWPKPGHLARMQASGQFRWCRELIMHSEERGDAHRLVDLLRSHGGVQVLLREGMSESELGLDEFRLRVRAALGEAERTFWFTYRARIGVVKH